MSDVATSESGPDKDSEIPTPSTGYNHTISPNYSRTSTFTNELKRTSPRRRTLVSVTAFL